VEDAGESDMIRFRFVGVVVIGAVATIGGTWMYGHRRSETARPDLSVSSTMAAKRASSAAPVPGIPHSESMPVKSPAESSEFFVKTMACRDIPVMLSALRKNGNCGPALPDAESQADRASCLAEGPNVGDEIRKLEDQQRGCSGFDVTPGGVFVATRAAADQGDVRAQHCFIGGMFADQQQGKAGLPQTDVDAYPALASKYIEESLARGDWSTVWILSQRNHLALGATRYGVSESETEYRMTKLLQLGANEKLAVRLAHNLDNFTQETATPLTPEAVAAGDEWARDEYATHFGSSTRLDALPSDGCDLPSDAMP